MAALFSAKGHASKCQEKDLGQGRHQLTAEATVPAPTSPVQMVSTETEGNHHAILNVVGMDTALPWRMSAN